MKQKKNSKQIDLIDISSLALMDIWAHKKTLLQLAMLPLFVKTCSYLVILLMGLQEDLLKQGMYFIPSYFLDGWLIAVTLRLLVHQEQWPFFLIGENSAAEQKQIQHRRNAIQACGVLYVLLKLVSYACISIVAQNSVTDPVTVLEKGEGALHMAEQSPSTAVTLFAVVSAGALLFASVWAFRYACLYVPVAIGMRMKSFLKLVWGLKGSVHLIFISIFCFLPFFLGFEILHNGVAKLFGNPDLASGHLIYNVLFSVLQSFMEVIINLVTATAIAYYIVRLRVLKERSS